MVEEKDNLNAEAKEEKKDLNKKMGGIPDLSTNQVARIAGFLYLLFILTSLLADQLACFTSVDATAVIDKITANESLFRIGIVSNLLCALFFLLAAYFLYILLKPVNSSLALLFLLLNLAGVVIQCISALNLFTALHLLSGAEYLNVYQTDQLKAQAILHINLYENGFVSAQLFFGTWLFPLGYLVYKSGFLPRFLGILLMIDCFAILLWFFQFFLLPDYEVIIYPGLAISLIAELSISLWLLIKGVKIPEKSLEKSENS